MNLLVCGGRNYSNSNRVFAVLDRFREKYGIDRMVSVGDDGADFLAWKWSMSRETQCLSTPAEWKKFGKPAGPMRNTRQLVDGVPGKCIAFPGGAGTRDMVAQCEACGVEVFRIDWKEGE